MRWNWQLPDWPTFSYDAASISQKERQFLLDIGGIPALLKNFNSQDRNEFIIEILSQEGAESSKIEGDILDRESLRSSIKRHFGLKASSKKEGKKESRMASLLCDVYGSYREPLTHEMLWKWHAMLFDSESDLEDTGKYRTHHEPMQIISRRHDIAKVYFEAPPSEKVTHEMDGYINWFNSTKTSISTLERAAIAHLYFECIHPFEDGNGRIGRILVEKTLSQAIGKPVLISVSRVLEQRKKEYYAALERCNRTLQVTPWVHFFADVVLQAEKESARLLHFFLEKSKMLTSLASKINPRQEKVMVRMFGCGPSGFKGGLSAENYIAITKASRATATRDLSDLVDLGALRKTGELRHTRYWLNLE